jgi:methenyltetrahydromethanopterin cyclohydrolase
MKLTEDILHGLIKEVLENYSKSETKFFGKGIAEIIEKGNDVYKNDKAFLNPAWIVKNIGQSISFCVSSNLYF